MTGWVQRVLGAVRAGPLWGEGDSVAVAVSGGVDSMVLLTVLAKTQRLHGGTVFAVTVDHGTRDDTEEDVALVQRWCARLQVPAQVFRVHPVGSSEAALRQARFEALNAVSADAIALAHHADDQVETLLINLLRGTSLRGLAGMRAHRDRFVRPLLQTPKSTLIEYARNERVPFREDSTNASDAYLRNRVRQQLIPVLETIRPGSMGAIRRTAAVLAEDLDYIADQVPELARGPRLFPTHWVATAPMPLVRRAFLDAAAGLTLSHVDAIRRCAQRGSGVVAIGEGREVVVDPQLTGIKAVTGRDTPTP